MGMTGGHNPHTARCRTKPCAVDLFCGAGALSYGMKQAGIEISAGIDADPACRYPFEANVGARFYGENVSDVTPGFIKSLFRQNSASILAGCAPCQPFSCYNRMGRHGRWGLLSKFGDLVGKTLPDVVTMENVPGLERYPVFKKYACVLERHGYDYDYAIVNCAEYGVPQTRKRLVLLASRLGHIGMIKKTRGCGRPVTVRDSIRHMERIQAGGTSSADRLHRPSTMSKRNLKRIRSSAPGGTWHDWDARLRSPCHRRDSGQSYPGVYGRMEWDKPAPTITTQFNGFGNGRFGHPEQDRAISLREGALLQTFPEDYSFVPEGRDVEIGGVARMIGNAVPVRLGRVIGRHIMKHLKRCG